MLLKKYKNDLFDKLKELGMDPSEFTLVDGDQGQAAAVFHRTGVLFEIWPSEHSLHEFTYRWSLPQGLGDWYPEYPTTINNVLNAFANWLKDVVRPLRDDEALPDLWSDLHASEVDESSTIPNTPFTSNEKPRLVEALRQIESTVQERRLLTPEQADLLHERIEYLIEASERLGRKDWINAAVGALMGFTIQAALTSDAARELLTLAGEALRWITATPLLLR